MTTKTKAADKGTRAQVADKGTPIQVQEGSGVQDPTTTEFVRRGMQTFDAVNQSLLRMQHEISLLRNAPGIQTPSFGFAPHPAITPSSLWGNRAVAPSMGQGIDFAQPHGPQGPLAAPGASFVPPHIATAPPAPYGTAPHLHGQHAPTQASAGQLPGAQWPQFQEQAAFLAGFGTLPLHDPSVLQRGYGGQAPTDAATLLGAFGNLGYPVTQQSSGWGINPAIAQRSGQNPWSSSGQVPRNVPTETPFGAIQGQILGVSHQSQPFLQSGDLRDAPPQTRTPSCNVVDEGEEYQVRMELPGVTRNDLDITCYANSVVVSARSNVDLDDGALLVSEAGNVVYRRIIQLPAEIKTSECKANLHDGILRLDLAKVVPTEAPRRLDVAYR